MPFILTPLYLAVTFAGIMLNLQVGNNPGIVPKTITFQTDQKMGGLPLSVNDPIKDRVHQITRYKVIDIAFGMYLKDRGQSNQTITKSIVKPVVIPTKADGKSLCLLMIPSLRGDFQVFRYYMDQVLSQQKLYLPGESIESSLYLFEHMNHLADIQMMYYESMGSNAAYNLDQWPAVFEGNDICFALLQDISLNKL